MGGVFLSFLLADIAANNACTPTRRKSPPARPKADGCSYMPKLAAIKKEKKYHVKAK
jgi:hypothetical protein